MSHEPSIGELISQSSLGGSAWCSLCDHPDLLHTDKGCLGVIQPLHHCTCSTFRAMSPEEWLRRRGGS